MEHTSGQTLQDERLHAELTQAQVAARMGVRRQTITEAEARAFVKPAFARKFREAISDVATPDKVA